MTEEEKRKTDIINLNKALNSIHLGTIYLFIEEMPFTIIGRIFYFKDLFNSIMDDKLFQLNDKELLRLLNNFKDNLNKTLSYSHYYKPYGSGNNLKFYMQEDLFPSEESEKAFRKLERIRIAFHRNFKELLNYLRNNYFEIDLEETSRKAYEKYKKDVEKE